MSETADTRVAHVDADARGSRLDAWWARVLSTPGRRRAWAWGGPALVVLIAAVARLWNLGHPATLVFDETYYVKDAYTLLNLGFEASWPEGANDSFNAGNPDVYTDDPSYVAHPPLGKWVIALGLAAFGAENPVGWRISTAIVGVLTVALLMAITHALFRSSILTVIGGGLLAIDGNAIVMSRVALLDGIIAFLVLLAFGALLLDRWWAARRLERWIARRLTRGRSIGWGPSLWWRPWLLSAGLLLGLAAGVKWNAAYFLAAFGLYSVIVDIVSRRRAGIDHHVAGTLVKQAPVSFVLMVPIAIAAYLATWTGWFATDGGYYRSWAEDSGEPWTGALSWVPLDVQSWWHYQASMYDYHVGETRPHGYQANPLTWLLLIRPTSMYYRGTEAGQEGCAFDVCGESITGIANPIIWYGAVAAAFYLVYRLIRFGDWRIGLILMALAAGYLPWLQYLHRTVFQFYTIVFEPYLVLALVFAIGLILGSRSDPTWRRQSGIRVVGVFLVFAVAVSAFFYPIWTGMQVPWPFIQLHYWLPGWR